MFALNQVMRLRMKNGGEIRKSCSRASLILPYLFRSILPGQFFDIRLSMKRKTTDVYKLDRVNYLIMTPLKCDQDFFKFVTTQRYAHRFASSTSN